MPSPIAHRLAAVLRAGCLAPVLALAGAGSAPQAAHVHGLATLGVTVDERSLALELITPLDTLLGFERAPRTEAERAEVVAMRTRLEAADRLFEPDPAAHCHLEGASLESETLGLGESSVLDEDDGRDDGPVHSGEHADIEVRTLFHCAAPARFVEVRGLFRAFDRVHSIDARIVTIHGQSARRLTSSSTRLDLGH